MNLQPNRNNPCSNLRSTRRKLPLCFGILSLLICTVVDLTTGCTQKDLIYPLVDACRVKVLFDWSHAPNAHPEGMTLIFYPCNTDTRMWRFDIADYYGGYVELPAGEYKVLTVNNDLPGLRFINTSHIETFEAVSVKLDPEDMMPSGMLYGTTKGTDCHPVLSIPAYSDSWHASQREYTLTLTPDSLCSVLHLDILNLHNAKCLRSVSACISGIPYALMIESEHPEDPAMHARFTLEPIIPDSSVNLYGCTSMLGTPMPNVIYELSLTAIMNDGSAYKKSFDVTPQLLNSPWLRNIFITINNVELPSGGSDSTGSFELGADVDGWSNVIIEIITGP